MNSVLAEIKLATSPSVIPDITIEQLQSNNYKSKTRNIALVFKECGLIEKMWKKKCIHMTCLGRIVNA